MQPDLRAIRRNLGLRYGAFVAALLLVFALGVYGQVSRARHQLERLQLQQLAETAAAELALLHHEADEMERNRQEAGRREGAAAWAHLGDGPQPADQRILWFDDRLRRLQQQGRFEPAGLTLPPAARATRQWLPVRQGLALWLPVISRSPDGGTPRLQGYVAVALAGRGAEQELARLRHGLLIGALLTGLLACVAAEWMLVASLEPIRRQIERLIGFTADASHELRHPLAAIRALIGSLRHGPSLAGAPPELIEKLALIDQASRRMGKLLEDLLLLSRSDRAIDDGRGVIDLPLHELLEDLVDLHRSEAAEAGRRLQLCLEGQAVVRGHPVRLRQLLENLLANALRFSPAGSTVSLGLARRRQRAVVWVEDQGPGIPAAQRQQVFERFWQADPSRSGPDHHGLGLSIAQAIARAHGGRLLAEEARGGGARMVLELPLRA